MRPCSSCAPDHRRGGWRTTLRAILAGVFFLCGASALAYEVTWVRLLVLTFGVSVYAASAVLTAFMGGLALGSWLSGPLVERLTREPGGPARLLRAYAAIQVAVAGWAILTPTLVARLTPAYVALYRGFEPGFHLFNLERFALASLTLLPPTILMGGSFPVLAQLLARQEGRRGETLGSLYAANTLGGVAGALGSGFLTIRMFGAHATIGLAAALDVIAAGIAFWLSFSPMPDTGPLLKARPATPPAPASPSRAKRGPTGALVLFTFAVSGLAALGYEVVWVRLLSILSLNAVFSFSIMLATFLAGLAAGAALMTRAADRLSDPLKALGWLQVAVGTCSILVMFLFGALPRIIPRLVEADTVGRQMLAEAIAAALTMLPATLLMGAAFPVAARVYSGGTEAVGPAVGRLYAFNTVGAALGSLVAGLVLIPAVGLKGSVLALSGANLAAGALLALHEAPRAWLRLSAALAGTAAAAALLPAGIYLGFREVNAEQLIFYREGADATVAVFQSRTPAMKISYVNGRSEVPTDPISMRTFYLLGHLPPLLNPSAKSALMVSFGNGIATGAMSRHGIPMIHAVDLVEGQIEAARLYRAENRDVLSYPGLTITIEDGRNYVLRSSQSFDIITADSTHPTNTSSWALFTREFYTLVRQRLAGDGVFLQWLPIHDLSLEDYRGIIGTFQSVFPHTSLWYTGGPHTFMLATPARLDRQEVLALQDSIAAAGVADDIGDARRLAGSLLMTEEAVASYVRGARIITDDTAFFIPAIELETILASLKPYALVAPPRQ